MHYVGYAELAAAVSNAGGLGVITALTVARESRAKRDQTLKARELETNRNIARTRPSLRSSPRVLGSTR